MVKHLLQARAPGVTLQTVMPINGVGQPLLLAAIPTFLVQQTLHMFFLALMSVTS
jgi:hypothetical protein